MTTPDRFLISITGRWNAHPNSGPLMVAISVHFSMAPASA
jgi:hypothetical protein